MELPPVYVEKKDILNSDVTSIFIKPGPGCEKIDMDLEGLPDYIKSQVYAVYKSLPGKFCLERVVPGVTEECETPKKLPVKSWMKIEGTYILLLNQDRVLIDGKAQYKAHNDLCGIYPKARVLTVGVAVKASGGETPKLLVNKDGLDIRDITQVYVQEGDGQVETYDGSLLLNMSKEQQAWFTESGNLVAFSGDQENTENTEQNITETALTPQTDSTPPINPAAGNSAANPSGNPINTPFTADIVNDLQDVGAEIYLDANGGNRENNREDTKTGIVEDISCNHNPNNGAPPAPESMFLHTALMISVMILRFRHQIKTFFDDPLATVGGFRNKKQLITKEKLLLSIVKKADDVIKRVDYQKFIGEKSVKRAKSKGKNKNGNKT